MDIIKNFLSYNKDDSLIRDSFILLVGSMFANLAGFFYHFYMGRVLGPEDYGVLGVIFSIVYLINVPATVVQTGVTKYTADFLARGKGEGVVVRIYKLIFSRVAIYTFLLMIVFLLLSTFIAGLLKISLYPLLVFSPYILFALMLPVLRGYLQGKQFFKLLGLNLALESIFKLVFGIGLVYLSFRVYGAVMALAIASFLACLLIYFKIKKLDLVENHGVEKSLGVGGFKLSNFYNYIAPVFFALLFLTLLYTIDVFIVKHFFSEHDAGLYAALSLIGRVIFYASSAVSLVMFPKVADLNAKGKASKQVLYKSFIFTLLIGVPFLLLYLFFPKIVVLTLMGSAYLSITGMLWMFGLVMLLFSLNYLLVFYNLSLNRRKFLIGLLLWFILECVLLGFFHSSFSIIVSWLILLNATLLIYLIIYTLRKNK